MLAVPDANIRQRAFRMACEYWRRTIGPSETAKLAKTERNGSLWLAVGEPTVCRHDPAEFDNLFHASRRIQWVRLT